MTWQHSLLIASITLASAILAAFISFLINSINHKAEILKQHFALKTPLYDEVTRFMSNFTKFGAMFAEIELANRNTTQNNTMEEESQLRKNRRAESYKFMLSHNDELFSFYLRLEAIGSRKVAVELIELLKIMKKLLAYIFDAKDESIYNIEFYTLIKKIEDQQIAIVKAIRDDLEVNKTYKTIFINKRYNIHVNTKTERVKSYKEFVITAQEQGVTSLTFDHYNRLFRGEIIVLDSTLKPLKKNEKISDDMKPLKYLSLLTFNFDSGLRIIIKDENER
jgi:hypothetical protein